MDVNVCALYVCVSAKLFGIRANILYFNNSSFVVNHVKLVQLCSGMSLGVLFSKFRDSVVSLC
jgi:hypothetical protein